MTNSFKYKLGTLLETSIAICVILAINEVLAEYYVNCLYFDHDGEDHNKPIWIDQNYIEKVSHDPYVMIFEPDFLSGDEEKVLT